MELIAKPDEATRPEIPEDWSYDYLDQHSSRGTGHTPDKKKDKYYDGSIVWVSLADSPNLDSGEINESKITISKEGIANSSTTLFPKGTVILSRDAGVGKSAITGCELCVSQHFVTWICNEETLHNWYLYYWLQFQKGVFERIAMGSTVKTIGLTFFQEYHVPLPSYEEQRAIAEALSDVDALIERLDALIAKKRAIKTATMQQLLTGEQRLPGFDGAWETRRLGDLSEMSSGGTPLSSVSSYYGGSIPWASVSDLSDSGKYLSKTERHLTTEGLQNSAAKLFPSGSILYAMYASIGEVRIASVETSSSQAILGIRTREALVNDFLYYMLCHRQSEIQKMGQQGTQANLNAGMVKNFDIQLPERKEQQAIADILSDMDAEIEALEARRDKTQNIKQGMMQELLTGRTRLV